jgi:hypothetical protein
MLSAEPIPRAFEDARHDLLIRVGRREIELDAAAARPDRSDQAVLVGEHLACELLYLTPDVILQIPCGALSLWGVTWDVAFQVARDNLLRLSTEPFIVAHPGVFVSPWRDNCDAGRMAIPELIRRLPVKGDPVAVVPNRDTLIVTGSDDDAGLTSMMAIVEEAKGLPRFQATLAVRLNGTTWGPFLPAPERPAYLSMRRLFFEHMAAVYAKQTRLLGTDTRVSVFPATYWLNSKEDPPEVFSSCAWSRGVPTLLPRTDWIVFGFGEPKMAFAVDWGVVTDICGELMEPVPMYPERFRVNEFPSPEHIEAFKKCGPGKFVEP